MQEFNIYDEMQHYVIKSFKVSDKDFTEKVNNEIKEGYVLVKSAVIPGLENTCYICVYANVEPVLVRNSGNNDFGTVYDERSFREIKL